MKLLTTPDNHIPRCLAQALGGSATLLTVDDHACLDEAYLREQLGDCSGEVIVNGIEFDDFDGAEYQRENAYSLNGMVPRLLARLAREAGCRLIQLSTVHVFDGLAPRPYREDDEAVPATVYGDSKLLGERYCLESGADCHVLRIGDYCCPGIDPRDTLEGLMPGDDGMVVALRNQRVAPLYIPWLAPVVGAIASGTVPPILHAAPEGETSPARFLQAWCLLAGGIEGPRLQVPVREVASEEFLWPAERPLNALLDSSVLRGTTGISMAHWERGLVEFAQGEAAVHRVIC